MSVCPGFPFVAQNRRPYPVSTSRSSNRTGGFPASGSPTGFANQHTDRSALSFAGSHSSFRGRRILGGGCRQHGHSPDSWPLPQRTRSQAPSLHRRYPASTVLWACPTPQAARPVPRGRPVGSHAFHRLGSPVLRRFSVGRHAVASTPVATRWGLNLLPRIRSRRRPSPSLCWVGCHIMLFEACTAFTFVTACLLAESPSDPLHRRLRRFRCLHRRSDCYRPEQEEAGWGLHPLKNHALHGAQRGRI